MKDANPILFNILDFEVYKLTIYMLRHTSSKFFFSKNITEIIDSKYFLFFHICLIFGPKKLVGNFCFLINPYKSITY